MADELPAIEIFRPGRHRAASGAVLSFSQADLAATAAAYDPDLHEAPIVVGHPDADDPAYGWVGAVDYDADGGALTAAPRQVDPHFAELVRAGRYKKVSAAFYAPDAPANPKPGAYYLRHVGFLGAQPPALKGLKPVAFADDAEGVVTVEFGEFEGRTAAGLFRRLRDWLIGEHGLETADQVLPGYEVDWLAESAAKPAPEPASTGFSEPAPDTPDTPDPKEPEMADHPAADAAALEKRATELAEKEAAFAEREREARRAADKAYVDTLVAQGKVPAKMAGTLAAFMEALPDGEGAPTIAFGEGDDATAEAPRDVFKRLVEQLPQLVAFGEAAPAEDGGAAPPLDLPAGYAADPVSAEMHAKAVAFAEANEIDYMTAVRRLQAAN